MSPAGPPSAGVDGSVTFGLGPASSGTAQRTALSAFQWVLMGATGCRSTVRVFDSYGELLDQLEGLTFAWLPPATFVRAQTRMPLTIVRGILRGTSNRYRSVLFTREGPEVPDLAALQGVRVAWVDRDSCSGHLFPRLALRSTGLHPHDVFAEEFFLGSHGAVVDAVGGGFTDVGATYLRTEGDGTVLDEAFTEGSRHYRVLLVSDPIPADVIVAGPTATDREMDALRHALDGLSSHDEGRALMSGIFDAPCFVETTAADYQVVRDALAALLA